MDTFASFDIGFPTDKPTVDEIDAIPGRIAAVQGIAKGQTQRAISTVQAMLDPLLAQADMTAARMIEPVESDIAAAQILATSVMGRGHEAVNGLLLAPTETAMRYGYVPGGAVGAGKRGKRRRRKQTEEQPLTARPSDQATAVFPSGEQTDPPEPAPPLSGAVLAPQPTGHYTGGTYIAPRGTSGAPADNAGSQPSTPSGSSPGLTRPGTAPGRPPLSPPFPQPQSPPPGSPPAPQWPPVATGQPVYTTDSGMTPTEYQLSLGQTSYPVFPFPFPTGTRTVATPTGRPIGTIPIGNSPLGKPIGGTIPVQLPRGYPLGQPTIPPSSNPPGTTMPTDSGGVFEYTPSGGIIQPSPIPSATIPPAGTPGSQPPMAPPPAAPPGVPAGGMVSPTQPATIPPGGAPIATPAGAGTPGGITPVTAGGQPVTTSQGRNLVIQVNACCEPAVPQEVSNVFERKQIASYEFPQGYIKEHAVPEGRPENWSRYCFSIPSPGKEVTEGLYACITGPAGLLALAATTVQDWLRKECAANAGTVVDWLANFGGSLIEQGGWREPIGWTIFEIANVLRCSDCIVERLSEWIGALSGCPGKPIAGMTLMQLVAGIWERWIGNIPQWLKDAGNTAAGYLCPTELPSQAEADLQWLRGQITDRHWDCLTRAAGNRVDYAADTRNAGMPWPTPDEYYQWKRRKLIPDGWDEFYRQSAGLRDPLLYQIREQAQQWLPAPTDAIDWMLKDVADPNITGTFGLGAEFEQKYTGRVKEVFQQNGISDADSLNIWKAHWRNMPPHQLYEMHKRLRPGWTAGMTDDYALQFALSIAPRRPSGWTPPQTPEGFTGTVPKYYFLDDLENKSVSGKTFLENLVTTGFHLYEALGQADYPPFWRERLMAVSYNVLTRVDARRAYETSQIDDAQLAAILQDRGYSPVDAVRLVGFFREAYIQLMARSPAANQWVKIGYDTGLLRQALLDRGMRADIWESVLSRLKTRRAIVIQTGCIDHAKRQYLLGMANADKTMAALIQLGLDQQRITELIGEWNCLKKSAPKHETAANICLYYKTGIISGDQARHLLQGLGYTRIQARRILSLCYLRKTPKSISHMPPPGSKEADILREALEN